MTGKYWYWNGPWSRSPKNYEQASIEEIVRVTMRNMVARGHRYNSGAEQYIIAAAKGKRGDALLTRIEREFCVQEREVRQQYWGA